MNAFTWAVASQIGMTPAQYALACGCKLWACYGRWNE